MPLVADPADGREAVLAALLEGNRRWAAGEPPVWGTTGTRFPLLDHRPAAAVLACADARVPVDLVFDQPSGVLFVVRLAGNPATPEALASLRFAVETLGVPFVMVLGHEACGAMAATVRTLAEGTDPGDLASIVDRLAPSVRSLGASVDPDDPAAGFAATVAHARRTAADLAGQLGVPVAAGVYRVSDGAVELVGGSEPDRV